MSDHWCMAELMPYASVAYSNLTTIQSTYDIARRVILEDVPGDLVECGVGAGAQIGVMGHAVREHDADKRVWAFDSYRGIPLAGPNDVDQPGIGAVDPNRPLPSDLRDLLKSSGVAAHSLDSVQSNLRKWGLPLDRYTFVQGWFQDTVPVSDVGPIAFLRLDGDLYESTKVCLEHLFPKISPGGYLVVDDYAMVGCRKAVDEYLAPHGLTMTPLDADVPEVHWCRVGG
jgi:hypothetical protein